MEKRSPCFIRAILPNFSERLSLPKAFLEYLAKERLDKATLVSPLGKWEVKVHGNLSAGLWFGGEGWAEFVTDHGVWIGDFVVFEHRGGMVFDVIIMDSTACSKSYSSSCQGPSNGQGCSPVKISEQKNKSDPSGAQGGGVPSKPTFTTTLVAYNFTRSYVALPMQFKRDAGLGRRVTLKIKDKKERSWPVNIYNGKSRGAIGKGWTEFAEANKLEIGDVCTFELVSSDLMEVHVSKQGRK